jgi:hypothetical protein
VVRSVIGWRLQLGILWRRLDGMMSKWRNLRTRWAMNLEFDCVKCWFGMLDLVLADHYGVDDDSEGHEDSDGGDDGHDSVVKGSLVVIS